MAVLPPTRATAGQTPVKRTYTYKTVGDIRVRADVYRPDDGKVRPVVVWLHGGALIVGSRADVPKDLLALCRSEGYVLVSFDYRLAPEVKLPAILDDLRDAFRWLRERGPKLFHANPARVAVAGRSAGGYLTLMAGVCVRPRPPAHGTNVGRRVQPPFPATGDSSPPELTGRKGTWSKRPTNRLPRHQRRHKASRRTGWFT
jgi:acetyl esterase/lipase